MATIQEQLDDARAAYHRLMVGTQVVKVRDQNGEEVTYSAASAQRLLAYINTLQDILTPHSRINAPMRPFF